MKERLIPQAGASRRLVERLPELRRTVEDVVRSGVFTNGPRVAALERQFEYWLGTAGVVAVNSGSSALRAAYELLDLPAGSEIIVPAYTFVMTAYAISDAFAAQHGSSKEKGLVPVFVDVDPHTYTLSPERVRAAITLKTKAIVAVHLFGHMAEMRALRDLAEAHGLFVIEDAAQAIGASYRDPKTGEVWQAGNAGDLGCFSLSSVKNLGSMGMDAGMLTISRRLVARIPDFAERTRSWRDTGRTGNGRYRHEAWGVRARMDEYAAAECVAELPFLRDWRHRRQRIAERYSRILADSAWQAPTVAPECTHGWFAYQMLAPDTKARDALVRLMNEADIEVAQAYTVVPDQEPYRMRLLPCRRESLEVSHDLEQLLLQIPCYPELAETEIERIEEVLAKVAAMHPAHREVNHTVGAEHRARLEVA